MPTPTKGARLGGSPSHERIILANLASQLFEHKRIVTTEAKARRVRPLAEKLITKAKRGDLHARRQVMTTIRDKSVVHVLFTEIAPTFEGRAGGYTRITKVGPRKGDNAPMAVIELVTESIEDSVAANLRDGASAKKAPVKKAAAVEPEATEESAEVTEETAAPEAEVADDATTTDAKDYGEGSFRGEEPPTGFAIKGNEDSMKFHTAESQWYDATVAEVWFETEAAAEAAGFTKAG